MCLHTDPNNVVFCFVFQSLLSGCVYASHTSTTEPHTWPFYSFYGVGSDKESYAGLYPILLFRFLPTMWAKFRYCSLAACFSSLAQVHRHSPEHSGLTGSYAVSLQFMRCRLLLDKQVQARGTGSPTQADTFSLSIWGGGRILAGPQSARQNLAWGSLLCGGSIGPRVPRGLRGSRSLSLEGQVGNAVVGMHSP